ncbi:tetratricopeptide repeat protein 36 homolog isoform X2 [Anopheles darlingi]|uniref:tetratricopeptide repeat protein 36 homolog isoform X1 n=1 Tax=Anopheles darlingi TaxID=43151 RepID=UPI0021006762|nr:tetratricopeptide repeat protein 36 homolog isoform X1 [Anopheles darlingi]XP_049539559.1 tetratricopeptide repeat protein 36 homolog isoform X2 [Anopheles darlingi]
MNRLKKEDLSERDRQVLESIFNPSQIGGEEYLLQDEEKHLTDPQDADDVDDPRVKESQRLEIEAIALTNAGKLNEALEILGKSIETAPHRPAPWNNRAQVHCLLGQEIDALKDVERALELSEGNGRTGCRALCQRGILKRKNADTDGAREDFEAAARLGSHFARTQLIELNPYAALCNQMLREVTKF